MKKSAPLKWVVFLHLTSFGYANAEKASAELPKLREFSFPDDLSVNEETTLNCFVRRGTEPYRFAWFKNAVPLVPNDRMSVAQVSGRMTTLTFRNVNPEDMGNYTCQVSNPAGKDAVSATLHVTGGRLYLRKGWLDPTLTLRIPSQKSTCSVFDCRLRVHGACTPSCSNATLACHKRP